MNTINSILTKTIFNSESYLYAAFAGSVIGGFVGGFINVHYKKEDDDRHDISIWLNGCLQGILGGSTWGLLYPFVVIAYPSIYFSKLLKKYYKPKIE